MKTLLINLTFLTFILLFACSDQSHKIYDEKADMMPVIVEQLKQPNKEILLVFGANWCPDCVVFDELLSAKGIKHFIDNEFTVIKIDVGQEGRNQAAIDAFENPVNNGIPSIVILDKNGKLKHKTLSGELAKARDFTKTDMKQFFEDLGYKIDPS